MTDATFAVGVAATVVTIGANAIRSDALLRAANLAGAVLWFAHFSMMGAEGAVISLAFAVLVVSLTLAGHGGAVRGVIMLQAAASAVMLAVSPGAVNALALIAGLAMNAALSLFSGTRMTVMIAGAQVLWLAFAIVSGSLPALVANVLALCALVGRGFRSVKAETEVRNFAKRHGLSLFECLKRFRF